ncbi:MAG: hypothetical protein LUG98_08905, partial [Tannerellaceae bacterium]|nr:hypothetical protein [Tannerellaceae bacterium]
MKLKIISLVCLFSFFFVERGEAAGKKEPVTSVQSFSYTPRSVSKTMLSGIRLSRGINFSVISEVGGIMAGNPSSVPLEFVINLDVKNPNNQTVTMT